MKQAILVPLLAFAFAEAPYAILAGEQPHDSIDSYWKATFRIKRHSYGSPDGRLRAAVIGIGKKGWKASESRIEVRTERGKLISQISYGSPDGEHGKGVEQAAWTPNSQFFVWSMESSGGHSPWHHPTYFFSRKLNQVLMLDDFTGAITTPNFTLKAPDIIQSRRQQGEDIKGVPVTVRMSRLRPAKPPTSSHRIRSWSATRLCLERNGRGFLEEAARDLALLWGNPDAVKPLTMPLHVIAGRHNGR